MEGLSDDASDVLPASGVNLTLPEDTPIRRATVATITVWNLERQLDGIRERRLAMRLKVEAVAKVSTSKANLKSHLKFNTKLKRVQGLLQKIEDAELALTAEVNVLRGLAIEMED